jgi:hypothetical protein
MSKKTDEVPAEVQGIKAGEPIKVEGSSRVEVTAKLNELRKQAQEAGLKQTAGGFIQHNEGVFFFANITFNKP